MKSSGAASPGTTNITNNANPNTNTTTTTTTSTTALSPKSSSSISSSSNKNNNNNNNHHHNSSNNNNNNGNRVNREDNSSSSSNNNNNNNRNGNVSHNNDGGVQSNRNGITSKGNGYMKLNICPATGGQIEVNVPEKETVAGLKWNLSRKFRISTEKMTLLFKDRPLKEGSLLENQVTEFSRIFLFPNMESGMTFHRTDVGVIQALENLSESQVNDFLSGRAPLLLAMKLGDHMMFVQLQLSTSSCTQRSQTKHAQCSAETKDKGSSVAVGPVFNSTALAELGHNLSQKLRELSKLSTHPRVPGDHCSSATTTPATATTTTTPTTATPDNNNTSSFPVSEKHQSIPVASPGKPSAASPKAPSLKAPSSPVSQPSSVVAPLQASSVAPSPAATGNNAKSCSSEPISGAIIENMQHIGQGVYSGTFSGTLDPSLQDLDGKPKRNISTIIHILNDLLGATPQYRVESSTTPHNDRNILEHSLENKGGSAGFPGNQSEENNALRGKVKDLQMKMEEKRLRRRARRETPYPCNGIGHYSNTTTTTTSTTTTTTNNNNNNDNGINNPAASSLHFHHRHHYHHHHQQQQQQQHSSTGSLPGHTQMDVDEFEDSTTTTATTTITASNNNNNNNNNNTELGGKAAEIEMMPVAPTATGSSSPSSSSSSSLPSSSSSTSSSQPAENASYTSSNLEQESVLV